MSEVCFRLQFRAEHCLSLAISIVQCNNMHVHLETQITGECAVFITRIQYYDGKNMEIYINVGF